MTEAKIPSVNPSDFGSMAGLFRHVLRKFLQNVDDMLPARVVSYDRDSKRVQVQPQIMILNTDGSVSTRNAVASIPVLQLGGGNFVLDFPLNPGDLGYIKANDRDISLFLQAYTQSPPNTYRKHSFEDAVFIPAPMHGYSISEEDGDNVVLQTLDGTQRIAIWPDRIKITSDNKIVLDAPLVECTGPIITGTNPAYDQYATINGTLSATVDIIVDDGNISLKTHVHSGVDPGPGESGPPVSS